MNATADLWQSYHDSLRSYIARRVRNSADVDDLLQNVFIKVHEGLHKVRDPGSVRAWLYRVAANVIADHYRAQPQVAANSAVLPDELPMPETERDPVGELAECLQPLIDALPDLYREALVLSEIQGLPQKTVAAALGLSHSGAKSRVQRGRDKLKALLLDCCDIETARQGGIVDYIPRNGGCDGC